MQACYASPLQQIEYMMPGKLVLQSWLVAKGTLGVFAYLHDFAMEVVVGLHFSLSFELAK